MLRSPILWGTVLLVIAIIATLAGDDLSLVPLLLVLVGGWCFAFAFVNLTMRMTPMRNGVVVHGAGAVAFGAMMILLVEFGDPLISPLPDALRSVVVVLHMAAIPAVVWIWFGLLGRGIGAIPRIVAKMKSPIVTRAWEREQTGDGSVVRFEAVEMRMRTLVLGIIATTVLAGLLTVFVLIAINQVMVHFGTRLVIVAVGILVGLPLYFLFIRVMRRRAVSCVVVFGNDEVRVTVGAAATVIIPFHKLDYLRWRSSSDYARVELRGAGVELSLLAGLAKAAPGYSNELPDLPRRVFGRLESAGLLLEKTRRREVVTFARAEAPVRRIGQRVD